MDSNLDDCAVPYNSPAGQLIRACQATLSGPEAAADPLAAASALGAWIDQQKTEAVIAVRIAGLDLERIAAGAGLTVAEVSDRWGPLLARLDKAEPLESRDYDWLPAMSPVQLPASTSTARAKEYRRHSR